jgi:hypothetical protein
MRFGPSDLDPDEIDSDSADFSRNLMRDSIQSLTTQLLEGSTGRDRSLFRLGMILEAGQCPSELVLDQAMEMHNPQLTSANKQTVQRSDQLEDQLKVALAADDNVSRTVVRNNSESEATPPGEILSLLRHIKHVVARYEFSIGGSAPEKAWEEAVRTQLRSNDLLSDELSNHIEAYAQQRVSTSTEDPQAAAMLVATILREVNEKASSTVSRLSDGDTDSSKCDKPKWESETNTLYFRGEVCKKVVNVSQAKYTQILSAFEEEGWPANIMDPMEFGKRWEALRSLNKGMKHIEFFADGTGEGIGWRVQPNP